MTTVSLDKYRQAQIKANCVVDAVGNVQWAKQPLEVYLLNGERKVVLPGTKLVVSVDDLVANGATQLGSRGRDTIQSRGGKTRWEESVAQRHADGVPPNVYRANQRSIEYALAKGKAPPPPTWVGRRQGRTTEVFDTIEGVINAMNNSEWRTVFAKGRNARKGKK